MCAVFGKLFANPSGASDAAHGDGQFAVPPAVAPAPSDETHKKDIPKIARQSAASMPDFPGPLRKACDRKLSVIFPKVCIAEQYLSRHKHNLSILVSGPCLQFAGDPY